jgi:ABC-type Mn2+/Zn2+ transport system permease subunit
MKLAGVILATALLVLPGAIALRLSDRLWAVVALSVGAGVAGLIGGFIASIELNWQAGPSMVLVLTLMFALAAVWGWAGSRRAAA